MKAIFFSLSLLCLAFSIEANELKPINELYQQLPSQLLSQKSYQISLVTNNSQIELCPADTFVQTTTIERLTQTWWQQLIKAGNLAFEGRRRQQWLIQADRALMQLNKNYSNQPLSWCQIERPLQINEQQFTQRVLIVYLNNQPLPWINLIEVFKK